MFNAIWEFFFCPQHGILIQCWYMIPLVFAALCAYWKQAVAYVREKAPLVLAYVRKKVGI